MFDFRQEQGEGLVEVALILVLIAIIVVAVVAALGPQLDGLLRGVLGR